MVGGVEPGIITQDFFFQESKKFGRHKRGKFLNSKYYTKSNLYFLEEKNSGWLIFLSFLEKNRIV